MNTFTFYFLNGTTTTLEGDTPNQAFSTAYGAGALKAVDFYDEGPVSDEWVWVKDEHTWHSKQYMERNAIAN